ncbi:MAG: replicative DNA helicase [Alphaproteobacteria bacterium]|nr:MAG: replicative DNA helicase [Alphaproteobacteria bacterium]
MMLAPESYETVAGVLQERNFYRRDHQLIYRAICALAVKGKPFDAVTLGDWFDVQGLSEQVGGGVYLVELATTTPSAANIGAYAEIVRDKATLRHLIAIGTKIVNDGFAPEGQDAGQLLSDAIGELMRANQISAECEFTGKQAMEMAWNEVARSYENGGALPGITTGMKSYDEITGGLHDGDLVVIGARPAMGKTALMGSLAEAAAMAGKRPGIFSAEQPAMQLGIRRISAESGVGAARVRAGKIEEADWPKLVSGMGSASDREMWIYDRSAVTLNELVAVARKWKHQHDVGCLFIDYAQRVTVPGVDRTTEVATVARGLKNLARDLNIPVIALAQVVKGVDNRDDKRPKAGDLANSDELTREADQIVMLYRPVVHNNKAPTDLAELWIEKNRHGPIGLRRVAFNPVTMKFSDAARNPEEGAF